MAKEEKEEKDTKAVAGRQPTRRINAPDPATLDEPDTADAPPKLALAVENHDEITQAARSHKPAQAPTAVMESPIETGEEMVTVRPTKTGSHHIGNNRYDLVKNTPVKVPMSVKMVLAAGNAIYP